jgi:hypothetical protein
MADLYFYWAAWWQDYRMPMYIHTFGAKRPRRPRRGKSECCLDLRDEPAGKMKLTQPLWQWLLKVSNVHLYSMANFFSIFTTLNRIIDGHGCFDTIEKGTVQQENAFTRNYSRATSVICSYHHKFLYFEIRIKL